MYTKQMYDRSQYMLYIGTGLQKKESALSEEANKD